jgi:hypothetical protein
LSNNKGLYRGETNTGRLVKHRKNLHSQIDHIMESLSGFWNFREEFEYGKKHGELRLFQNGNNVNGTLVFKESCEDGTCLYVRCIIEGKFDGNSLIFQDVTHSVLFGGEDADYLHESREGIININGQFVGTAIDNYEVEGVFVIERII